MSYLTISGMHATLGGSGRVVLCFFGRTTFPVHVGTDLSLICLLDDSHVPQFTREDVVSWSWILLAWLNVCSTTANLLHCLRCADGILSPWP